MSMNEKRIVGESFEDLSDKDMAMLTGRGGDGVAPASLATAVACVTLSISVTEVSAVSISAITATLNHQCGH